MQSLQNHLRQLHDKQGDAADILYDVKNVCFREVPIDQLGTLLSLLALLSRLFSKLTSGRAALRFAVQVGVWNLGVLERLCDKQ